VSKKCLRIKQYIGKASFLFKTQCRCLIEENEIKIGDKILIRGTTTGEQELIIEEMLVNEVIVEKQLLAIYVPLNYLLESVYQIDCIKSKALFLS
jgi:UPF0176 protein